MWMNAIASAMLTPVPNSIQFARSRVHAYGVSGRSKYFDSDNESPIFGVQKGYSKIDARIQYGAADERWHVAVVGKNLTNEKTTGSAFNLPFPITAVPRAILYLEETRNIAVEAGMKF